MDNRFSFEKLDAWKESRSLVKDIYVLLRQFPRDEIHALTNQIRRAVISVPSNIAEGSGRVSPKEKSHYIEIAFGSLMEVYCQLQIANDLGYISSDSLNNIRIKICCLSKMLSGLRTYFQSISGKG